MRRRPQSCGNARVIEIKRRALNLVPVLDNPLEPVWKRPPQEKPRVLFVLPGKYGRLLRACVCMRAR
jgi:hypothetical protein